MDRFPDKTTLRSAGQLVRIAAAEGCPDMARFRPEINRIRLNRNGVDIGFGWAY